LKLTEQQLRKLYEALVGHLGAPQDEAANFADALVQADLRGFDGQGILLVNYHYLQSLRAGEVKPGSKTRIVKETPAMAVLDGGGGLGQVIGTKAMQLAVAKAKNLGVGVVSVRNSNDWGMTSYYSMKALEQDCVGIAMAIYNAPRVAPWGGRDPIFGTNPFSYAIPAKRHYPIVFDISTAASSQSRIYEAMLQGRKIPEGLILDSNGRPTTDPHVLFPDISTNTGAVLLTFGHRGYGLMTMVELLTGPLSGMGLSVDAEGPGKLGQFVMAIDIDQFTPIDAFKEKVDRLIDSIKSCRLAEGFKEIHLPGEIEWLNERSRKKEGIEVPRRVWEEVTGIAEELGIDWKKVIEVT
jgi:LDH2 family malate/lactate/ureidoglycolate dehydrogenase